MTSGPPWRVLLTIPNFVTAGSGGALVNLTERLDRNHFTPLVGVKYTAGAPLERRLAELGIDVLSREVVHFEIGELTGLRSGLHFQRGLLELEVAQDGTARAHCTFSAELEQTLFVKVRLVAETQLLIHRER